MGSILYAAKSEMFVIPVPAIKRLISHRERYNMRFDTFLGRLGAVCLLSLGYQVLHITVAIVLATMSPQGVKLPPEQQPTTIGISDGRPLLWHADYGLGSWEFRSPDGQPVKVREKQPFASGVHLFTNDEVTVSNFGGWSTVGFVIDRNYTEPWFFIQETVGQNVTGYFVAYSSRTRLPTLYLGANGQSATLPSPDQRFQLLRGNWDVVTDEGNVLASYSYAVSGFATAGRISILTKSGLEYVDIKARTVSRVVASDNLSSLGSTRQQEFVHGYLSQKTLSDDDPMLVRSSDTVFQIDHEKIATRYTIPESLRKKWFTAYPVDANTIYYATTLGTERRASFNPRNLFECDGSGGIRKTWNVSQPPKEFYSHRNLDYLAIAAIFPTPLHIVGSLVALNPTEGIDRAELIREVWPSFLVVLLCGILSAIGAWQLSPRFSGAPVQWGWLIFVFVFGLPGLVGYLMHFRRRRRPLLEPAAQFGTEVFA